MNLLRKKLMSTIVAATTTFAGLSGNAIAEETSFMDAVKNGKASLSFRYRLEDVEIKPETGAAREATANTLLTRLNYATGEFNRFSGFIEFDQVSELLEVDYDTWGPDQLFPDAAVISDPEGTDLNQVYIQYKLDNSTVRYGRQRINFDDQRWVGGVGWRQNEQTFDSSSFSGTYGKLKLTGAYVYGVNRLFGDQSPAGDHDNSTLLLNLNYDLGETATIVGYKYVIDNKNIAAFSSDTTGVRLTGKANIFAYTAEYATQSDNADNPVDYTADFIALEGSAMFKPIKVTVGYQLLGADEEGFVTMPLSTLHKFNGWSDVFINGGRGNIIGGIEDTYFSVGGQFGPVKASVIYHEFASNDADVAGLASDELGSEIGFAISGKAGPVALLLKYADFSVDDNVRSANSRIPNAVTDTSILWLQAGVKF